MRKLIFIGFIFLACGVEAGMVHQGPKKAFSVAVSSGPLYPLTCANQGAGVSWTNPTNAQVDDASKATVGLSGSPSRNLYCSTFTFNLTGKTIVGIQMDFKRDQLSGGDQTTTDSDIFLTKDGSTSAGNDKACCSWPTTEAYASYGDSSDLWGTTFTGAEVSANAFGVFVRATNTGFDTAEVNAVRLTIWYNP